MKNNKQTSIKININATEDNIRSSILSDNFPANMETNTTAIGVVSKNNPVITES